MILVCVALPLLLAVAGRLLPRHGVIAPVCAAITLAACLSLPWTGAALGLWLTPDPLGVHVAALASFAWLVASLQDDEGLPVAAVAGCLNLALLTGSPQLSVLAAGAAAILPTLAPGQPAAPRVVAASGLGLAVFGMALVQAAAGGGSSWAGLPEAASHARGAALGVGMVLTLLGLGALCLPWGGSMRSLAVLAGPLGGVWLVVALRLRGVLDGDSHAIAPGAWLEVTGVALLLAAVLAIRMGPARLLPGAVLGMVGGAAFGFGIGGADATAAGLLQITLGCLALTAAVAGGWAGLLGLAALAGIPPLGVFASAYGLFAAALARSIPLAVLFAVLEFALVTVALRALAVPREGRVQPIGWAGVVLTLGAGWALPPGVAAWLLGIAAAAR